MAIEEKITDYWQYWCYYETVIRNKNTGAEIPIGTGSFIPTTFGLMRIGERVTKLTSTTETVERYVSAFKPNIALMCNQDVPTKATLALRFLQHEVNSGESRINMKVKPFANDNGRQWTTNSKISFDLINSHYVPFDMTEAAYSGSTSTYEKTTEVDLSNNRAEFQDLEQLFFKFLRGQTIGFTLTADFGWCEMYGPSYTSYFLGPSFEIYQIVSARVQINIDLDTEITASCKVKGVCKDRNGNVIKGIQCRVIVFDPDDYKIIGTGLSAAATGVFLVTATYKVGYPVAVAFIDDTNNITGSEIMITLSTSVI